MHFTTTSLFILAIAAGLSTTAAISTAVDEDALRNLRGGHPANHPGHRRPNPHLHGLVLTLATPEE